MKLLVQKFLESKSFKQLYDEHFVELSFSKDRTKFSLNYSQLYASEYDELAKQCRGLILCREDRQPIPDDENFVLGESTIVACPFFRFLNANQPGADNVNFDDPNLKIQEKADGSCLIIYFCPILNEWCAATRACPNADIPLNDFLDYDFRKLFEKALFDTIGESFQEYTSKLDKTTTYIFELCTPFNQLVVKHKNSHVIGLGARDLKTLKEIPLDNINFFGVPKVYHHNLGNSLKDIIDFAETRDPGSHEGMVICDSEFKRLKIKSLKYVMMSKSRDQLLSSGRNILRLIFKNQEDDIVPYMPQEIVDLIFKMKENIKKLTETVNTTYQLVLSGLPENYTQKDYALAVQSYNLAWSAPFYTMHGKKLNNFQSFIEYSKIKDKNNQDDWSDTFLDRILELIK